MADRQSAGIYGDIFNKLAEDPSKYKELAEWLWGQVHGDFCEYQMGCNDALLKFGLAHMKVDPQYPDEGPTIVYNER